jgi:hypothetical protein
MGLTKRRLYKPERKPARTKGTIGKLAPISCLDASPFEVTAAVSSIAWLAGVQVGRGLGYDSLTDKYTVLGKSRKTGKVQDFEVSGTDVGALIAMTRIAAGEKMNRASTERFIARAG